MDRVAIGDSDWQRILALSRSTADPDAPGIAAEARAALALYGPLAMARGRFVLAQVGQSLDGRVATLSGDARDVSGCDGLAHLHRCRALVDAVIVGVGTVLADDPSLSVRIVRGKSPVRVVIDSDARLKGDERIIQDDGTPVIIIQAMDAPKISFGTEVIRIERGAAGLDPLEILDRLDALGLSRVLVEGGARTIARFIDAGLVDRLHVAIAPIIIGSGPNGFSLAPVERLSEAHRPKVTAYDLGSDMLFDCELGLSAAARAAASRAKRQDIDMADQT